MRERVQYFLKRPGNGRASFALIKRKLKDGSCRTVKEHKDFNALRRAHDKGALNTTDADFQLKAIVNKLNREATLMRMGSYTATEANLKLFESYWEEVYSRRKVKVESARNRLRAALASLGPVSLLAPINEVQTALDQATHRNPRRQRRHAVALNQMRKYFGQEEMLALEKKQRPEFKYLSREELKRLVAKLSDPHVKALCSILFNTGLRTGEAYALKKNSLREDGFIFVSDQVDRSGVERGTKTDGERFTFLLDPGAFHSWMAALALPRPSRYNLAPILKGAAMKLWPEDPSKWVTPHDLRHSYAVLMMTEHRLRIQEIAKLLGNSTAVCEEYYTRFVHSDTFRDTINRIVKQGKSA